ncbi:MAG: DUF2974 domain-containing protein [Erysipelotrichaceae bacterium]|nr:DUF2974 domain-containing protein [Erysipelotrichaceae bacterium]
MNFVDYCKWRGDLSFRQDPFNEVDNMLFAQIAYCELDDLIKGKEKMSLKQLSDLFFEKHSEEELSNATSFSKMSPFLMRDMANTKRFESCMVYNYADRLNPDSTKQFAAMMFDLPDESTVIAFRGTDDTLVVWKEDLMLSYGDISSQYDALDYVNNNCTMFNKYRIVGHSKGGYLALYSAIHAKTSVKRRILEIYSNDGPGLREGISDEDRQFLDNRYKLIVPEKDGVGMIYELADYKKICKVDVFNIISAHSMFTWQVQGNKVVLADKYKYESDLSRAVIKDILKETSREERLIFVDELFKHLAQENINTLADFGNRGIGIIYSTLKKLMDEDNESRIFAGKMMKILSRNIGSDLQQTISEKNRLIREKVSDLSNTAGSRIKEILPRRKAEQANIDEPVNTKDEEN